MALDPEDVIQALEAASAEQKKRGQVALDASVVAASLTAKLEEQKAAMNSQVNLQLGNLLKEIDRRKEAVSHGDLSMATLTPEEITKILAT